MVKILTSPVQGDVPFGGHKATGLADPTSAQDASTKAYVDAVAQGLSVKASVRAASTANIASQSGLLTVDGVTLVDGDRVLAKDQTTGSTNGIWVAHSGAWTRAADADVGAELVGAFVFVEEGVTNAGSGWVQTAAAPITVGTTSLTWVQFSGAGQIVAGAGLAKSGNTLRRSASATGYANLAALPSAASNNGLLERTADGGIYESDGSAWQPVRDPSGTYAAGLISTAVKTTGYAAAAGDLVPVDTTAGNVTVTLPTAPADGARVAVKHVIQGGTNTVSVACGGSDVFNKTGGSATLTLTLVNQAISLQYKASTHIWYVVSDDLPLGGLDGRFLSLAGGTDSLGRSYQIKWVVNPATVHSGAHGLWLERSTASSGIITLTLAEAGNPVWDAVALDTATTDIVLAYSHSTQTDQLRGSVQSKWLLANSAGHPLDESRLQIVAQSNENANNGLTEALLLSTASDSGVNYAIKWQIIGQLPTSLLGGIRFDGRAAFGALFSTYLTNGYVEAKGGVTAWMPSADPIFQLYRQTDIDKKYRMGINSSGDFYIEDTTRGVKPFTISSATGTVSIGDGIVIPSATSRVRATADQSVIDDGGGVVGVALINDPELTLPVVANGIYLIRAFLRYEASQTGDFKCGFLVPAGATVVWAAGGAANSLVGSTGNVNTVSPSGSTSQTYGGNGAGNAFGIRIDGTLVVGATAGNCVFRFAQGAADAAVATKRLANSFLSLERIG